MRNIKLGINIDHVATVRNARGTTYPSPLRAALLVQNSGADSVTVHLREDRRHILEFDLKNIVKELDIPINLEIAPTNFMLKAAIKYKPNYVCIVPEKREEITTEGGLNLKKKYFFLKKMIKKLKAHNIRVSLFIEPKISDVKLSKELETNCIEIHTGKYCNTLNYKKKKIELGKIKNTCAAAKKFGLEVHAGHGLAYQSTKEISKIKGISELNIGHFIISESIFLGLKKIIKTFKNILNK